MLLDYFFPKHSLEGEEGEWITEDELNALRSAPRIFSREELEKRGIESLESVFAMSSYRASPLLKKAIHTFKYRRIPGLLVVLNEELTKSISLHFPLVSDAILCPVPLHRFRRFQRGFNQAELLARSLGDSFGLSVELMLKRVRPTGHQTWRGRKERWEAVRGAFRSSIRPSIRSSLLRGATQDDTPLPTHVYLVDDVLTTGATLEECARTLKAAGVKRIEGIVLAYD